MVASQVYLLDLADLRQLHGFAYSTPALKFIIHFRTVSLGLVVNQPRRLTGSARSRNPRDIKAAVKV
eukprot:713792-Prorocentrum_minimum.AAC.1